MSERRGLSFKQRTNLKKVFFNKENAARQLLENAGFKLVSKHHRTWLSPNGEINKDQLDAITYLYYEYGYGWWR